MEDLFLVSYRLMTVLIPFFIVFFVMRRLDKKNVRPVSRRYFLVLCVFAVYIFGILHFTESGTVYELFRNTAKTYYEVRYNLLPFSYGFDVSYLLNVLLFFPLGILLPLLWPHANKFKYILFSSLALSLFIELSQLYGFRLADVDDLIMNTTGSLLGYLIYRRFTHVTKWKHGRVDYPRYEPAIYISAMLLGHFFLYDDWGLRNIIFGF
ncbi:MAG: VanZ family protein [Oscillospiraceae bacterium]|nr:VanZ family protein [Oscillospiraceae bacterium]